MARTTFSIFYTFLESVRRKIATNRFASEEYTSQQALISGQLGPKLAMMRSAIIGKLRTNWQDTTLIEEILRRLV
jgi:hypothetical protein